MMVVVMPETIFTTRSDGLAHGWFCRAIIPFVIDRPGSRLGLHFHGSCVCVLLDGRKGNWVCFSYSHLDYLRNEKMGSMMHTF
jgi:hypothetical protein